MPQTKQEKIIFIAMMGFMMSLGMETYNLCLQGITLNHYLWALVTDLPLMILMVMIFQPFIATPVVAKLAKHVINEEKDSHKKVFFLRTTMMVISMCPLMSFAATIFFKRHLGFIPSIWLTTFLVNLPMAYIWQFLVAGPLVRKAFEKIKPILNKKQNKIELSLNNLAVAN